MAFAPVAAVAMYAAFLAVGWAASRKVKEGTPGVVRGRGAENGRSANHKMALIFSVVIFLFRNASPGAAESKAVARPDLPYFDWNACPFEGCVYREWTPREAVPVYDTWKEKRRQITQLAIGDKVITKWPDGQGCAGTLCAATYVDLGKKAWWAKVKLRSGRTGWVDMNQANFDGVDLLAAR